jgi:hypothetical protein
MCTVLYVANISAQVHIGSESPPHASAMLEVSATNKGILFPSVALTAINDGSMIVNKKPVDGLLIFNTTENPSKNLYKGVYAWNSVKNLWENIVADQNFHSTLISHFAIEETYFAANITNTTPTLLTLQSNDPFTLLTFSSGMSVNKDNCFNTSNNTFIVPKSGYYKIACGVEVQVQASQKTEDDVAVLQLVFIRPNSSREEAISADAIRGFKFNSNFYLPLTPSVIYNGYIEKGSKIIVKAGVNLSRKNFVGYITRKYLYINTF